MVKGRQQYKINAKNWNDKLHWKWTLLHYSFQALSKYILFNARLLILPFVATFRIWKCYLWIRITTFKFKVFWYKLMCLTCIFILQTFDGKHSTSSYGYQVFLVTGRSVGNQLSRNLTTTKYCTYSCWWFGRYRFCSPIIRIFTQDLTWVVKIFYQMSSRICFSLIWDIETYL